MSAITNKLLMCQRLLNRSFISPKTTVACLTSSSQLSVCVQKHLQLSRGRLTLHGAKGTLCSKTLLNTHGLAVPESFRKQFSLSSKAQVSTPLIKGTGKSTEEILASQMNIRLVNENSFLSWCRNAYLSTVVGVAMITEGTTTLSQGAGIGALTVGTMNLFWGTACHINNLIRLRNVSGMSGFTLFLNLLGSVVHCLIWAFVLVCYVGFLDETRALDTPEFSGVPTEVGSNSVTGINLGSRDM